MFPIPSHDSALKRPLSFPDNLPKGWREQLAEEKEKEYFQNLSLFLKNEFQNGRPIFPAKDNILKALQLVDFANVQVCLLGQDPYHGEGQAMGLCFGVPSELKPKPPSLVNIFKEMKNDLGWEWDKRSSSLEGWAEQGVLLLNTVLSVEKGKAFSHRQKGWEIFTDRIIQCLAQRPEPVIFVLWGNAAQQKKTQIPTPPHFIISSAHPSPLSAHRGFFGSRPFSKINDLLKTINKHPIDWTKIENART